MLFFTDNVIRVRLYSAMGPQVAVNILHGKIGIKVGGGLTAAELLEEIDQAIAPEMNDLMCNDATFYGLDLTNLSEVPVEIPAQRVSTGGIGTAGASPLPGQVCGVFTKRSLTAGRRGRGRMYVPFPAAADCTTDTDPKPTTGYMTRLGLLAANLVGTQNYVVGALSMEVKWGIVQAGTTTFTYCPNAVARQKWGTQRSRGNYGRPNALPF